MAKVQKKSGGSQLGQSLLMIFVGIGTVLVLITLYLAYTPETVSTGTQTSPAGFFVNLPYTTAQPTEIPAVAATPAPTPNFYNSYDMGD